MAWGRWLSFGLALVLVFTLIQAPAWLVQQQAQRLLPELAWFSAEGTVWSGQGQGLRYQFGDRQLVFDRLQWRLRPLALLTGRLRLDVEAQGPGQRLVGELSHGLTGGWLLQKGELDLPVSVIAGPQSLMYGQVALTIDELMVDAERIEALQGQGVWESARWQAPGYIVALGNLDVVLDDDGGGAAKIALRNRDPADRIAVDLTLDLHGKYSLHADLAPGPNSRASWAPWLPLVARADNDGRYQVSNQGVLW